MIIVTITPMMLAQPALKFSRSNPRQMLTKLDVRFGSKADIRAAKGHVCFTPESR
jgi:hypothetical protein